MVAQELVLLLRLIDLLLIGEQLLLGSLLIDLPVQLVHVLLDFLRGLQQMHLG